MKLTIISIILSILFICSITSVSVAAGGGVVPVSTTGLSEQGNEYSMTPSRLMFEFNKEWYAIQLRRVKDEYAGFIVMDLDENKLDNITAYESIENEFNLNPYETRKIDLNGDKIEDVIIELDKIIKGGKYGTVRSAKFSIKRLTNSDIFTNKELENYNNISNEILQEQVIVTNLAGERKEVILVETQILREPTDLTFFQKIISWFKRLF